MQSTFARAVLNEQLQSVGVLKKGETIDKHDDLWHMFRNGAYMPLDGSFLLC